MVDVENIFVLIVVFAEMRFLHLRQPIYCHHTHTIKAQVLDLYILGYIFRRFPAYFTHPMPSFLVAHLEHIFLLAAAVGTYRAVAALAQMLSQEDAELLGTQLAFFEETAR